MNLPRGCGKTTNIIVESAKTGYPIIVMNTTTKIELQRHAKRITDIPITVYTIQEFTDDNFWRGRRDFPQKVLIDELPFVLRHLLGVDCEMATMTSESTEEYYGRRDFDK